MPDEALKREYEELYAWYDEGDTTAYERFAFDLLAPRRSGVYLNYGSGRWSRATDVLAARAGLRRIGGEFAFERSYVNRFVPARSADLPASAVGGLP